MKINLVMPMAGAGSRFSKLGYDMPKPLIDLQGRPFFEWAVLSAASDIDLQSLTFAVLKEHTRNFHIDKEIKRRFPKSNIVIIDHVLDGAVLTCLEAAAAIDNSYPVLFNDCDHLFRSQELADLVSKRSMSFDGALLTFKSNEDKFSYAKTAEDGFVTETKEKQVISNDAICGAYLFKSADTFNTYAQKYLTNCSYSEYFMSGVYNELIKDAKKVAALKTDVHISFGTVEEYEEAKKIKDLAAYI